MPKVVFGKVVVFCAFVWLATAKRPAIEAIKKNFSFMVGICRLRKSTNENELHEFFNNKPIKTHSCNSPEIRVIQLLVGLLFGLVFHFIVGSDQEFNTPVLCTAFFS